MVDITALPGSLDLFELMVNYVAGSIFLSLLIWALILLITAIMGRLSMQTIVILLLTYFAIAMVGFFGGIVAILLTLVAIYYATTGILNYINSSR